MPPACILFISASKRIARASDVFFLIITKRKNTSETLFCMYTLLQGHRELRVEFPRVSAAAGHRRRISC